MMIFCFIETEIPFFTRTFISVITVVLLSQVGGPFIFLGSAVSGHSQCQVLLRSSVCSFNSSFINYVS